VIRAGAYSRAPIAPAVRSGAERMLQRVEAICAAPKGRPDMIAPPRTIFG